MLAASIITAAATAVLAALAYLQMRAASTQTAAALAIAMETRAAAERQWQPRVIANPWPGPSPGSGDDAAPDETAVPYYLSNDGTGPAFNVEHGVEVAGKLHLWEYGSYRSMGAGLEIPPVHDAVGLPVSVRPIVVGVKRAEWDEDIVYCTRFENLLGEHFELRNFPAPARPAEFRHLS